MDGPQTSWLPGSRLHLNHGPIDLVIEAFGEAGEKREAYRQAIARFETVLTELAAELPELRTPCNSRPRQFRSDVAQSMENAACRHAAVFVTPMAAVAGSVADHILAAMTMGRRLDKAYVNNGGDIALMIGEGEALTMAVSGTGNGLLDRLSLGYLDPVRGVATSGWRGRSHSLGVADAVTVLARTGAEADIAATLIANAVDLPGSAKVFRRPAQDLSPDSDLGDRPVTVGVGALEKGEIRGALASGLAVAQDFQRRGLIEAAALFLGGEVRVSNSSSTSILRSRSLSPECSLYA